MVPGCSMPPHQSPYRRLGNQLLNILFAVNFKHFLSVLKCAKNCGF